MCPGCIFPSEITVSVLRLADNVLLMTILEPHSVQAAEIFDCRLNCSRSLQLIHPGELSVRMAVNQEDQSPTSQPVPQGQLGRFRFLVRVRGSSAGRSGLRNQVSNPLR